MEDLIPLLPPGFSVTHVGALDVLSSEEVKRDLTPYPGEETLVVRLNSGETIEISKARGIVYIQRAIRKAGDDGADAVIQLCTLPFPAFESRVPVLSPFNLLHSIVPAIAKGLRLGVLFPYESHAPGMVQTWKVHGLDFVWKCLAPATADGEAIARMFDGESVDIVVLDCIGYTSSARDKAYEILGKPVIQPKQLLVKLLEVML